MLCAFHLSFRLSFPFYNFVMGQARADGKGKLATSRPRADSGGEKVKMYAAIV
jgi:hypothetical protein